MVTKLYNETIAMYVVKVVSIIPQKTGMDCNYLTIIRGHDHNLCRSKTSYNTLEPL